MAVAANSDLTESIATLTIPLDADTATPPATGMDVRSDLLDGTAARFTSTAPGERAVYTADPVRTAQDAVSVPLACMIHSASIPSNLFLRQF